MQVQHLLLKFNLCQCYIHCKNRVSTNYFGDCIELLYWRKIEPVKSVCPTIAAIAVLLLGSCNCSYPKANCRNWFHYFVACLVQNLSGYVVTYFICKALSIDVSSRRAMQIEVAMQNSALSVSLALKHFTPQAAVAGAVSPSFITLQDLFLQVFAVNMMIKIN